MSVDFSIKVQYKEEDTWKTVETNIAQSVSWCGRWLMSFIHNSDLVNKGIPENVTFPEFKELSKEEYGYNYTHFTLDELVSFVEDKVDCLKDDCRKYVYNNKLSRIERKIDSLMTCEEFIDNEEDYDYDYCEDTFWDIIGVYKIIGYIQFVIQLYTEKYISDENIRIILWFS